jgi:phage gpG-like protein
MRAYVRERIKGAVYDSGVALQRHIAKNKLTGQVLKRRTGKLADSIALDPVSHAKEEGGKISIRVGTNVIYGKAWELGNVKNWQGKVQPARPFLVPALDDLRASIRKKLTMALTAPAGGSLKIGRGGH